MCIRDRYFRVGSTMGKLSILSLRVVDRLAAAYFPFSGDWISKYTPKAEKSITPNNFKRVLVVKLGSVDCT